MEENVHGQELWMDHCGYFESLAHWEEEDMSSLVPVIPVREKGAYFKGEGKGRRLGRG